MNKPYEPIFEENGEWYFWDETSDRRGPYASREEAEIRLKEYCEYLNN